MHRSRGALAVIGAGLLTFGVVFAFLEHSSSRAAPSEPPVAPTAVPTLSAAAPDSVARQIPSGDVAVALPIAGSAPLLRDLLPGDRLDIVASVSSGSDREPITGVVVHGATVLRAATSENPLLIEVAAPDAIVLAHVVLGGTRLSYSAWPGGAAGLAEAQPVAGPTARALLDVNVSPTPAPVATQKPLATPVLPAAPTPPVGTASGFLYQVQPGDSWGSVAAMFGETAAELRQWNEVSDASEPTPGSLVFIPRRS
jgi:hypothetical protein